MRYPICSIRAVWSLIHLLQGQQVGKFSSRTEFSDSPDPYRTLDPILSSVGLSFFGHYEIAPYFPRPMPHFLLEAVSHDI